MPPAHRPHLCRLHLARRRMAATTCWRSPACRLACSRCEPCCCVWRVQPPVVVSMPLALIPHPAAYVVMHWSALLFGVCLQGIEWSTPTVLAANLANAQRLALRVAPLDTLPTLPDVDTLEDLQRWCSRQQAQQQAPGSPGADEDGLLAVSQRVAAAAAQPPG